MDSGVCHQSIEGERKSGSVQKKRAWILGGAFDPWWAIALDLYQYGIEAKLLNLNSDLREVVSDAARDSGAIVVDLSKDIERGLAILGVCHGYSASVPLIPAVADPSLDLAQRLRAL